MPRKGVDVIGKIASGGATDVSDEIRDSQVAPIKNVLVRAVVVDVLSDIALRVPDDKSGRDPMAEIRTQITNPDKLDSAPRNSIIARVITGGQDKKGSSAMICYPLFPPHFCLPIKSGEQVWLINESLDIPGGLGYWLARVPEPDFVDDVNYTHGDRKLDAPEDKSTSEKAESSESKDSGPVKPEFPNGAGNEDAFTLTEENDYEKIVTGSLSYPSFTPEAVPRFTKRPGDFVLQGSNNTLISLGEDRGWFAINRPADPKKSNASSDDKDKNERSFAGTIDIVVGRGRFGPPDADTDPVETACRIIENKAPDKGRTAYKETDKNPKSNDHVKDANRLYNPAEGDPDLHHDSARIYVSMKTNPDVNFNVPTGNLPLPFEGEFKDSEEEPCVVLKSDQIRIIARKKEKDDPKDTPEINGSIRIIKEGKNDDDRASIIIQPDGSIHIQGSKIFLGRESTDGGHAGGPGPGSSQPYVRYQDLEDLLTEAFTNVSNFAASLQTTFDTNTTPGYGGPNPQLVTAASAECQTLQDDMSARIDEIPNLKSARIFGE